MSDAPATRPDLDALIARLNYEGSEDRRISRLAKQKHTKATLDQRAEVSEQAAAALATERARADQAEQRIADAPHAPGCRIEWYSGPEGRRITPCTCWKSAAPTAEK